MNVETQHTTETETAKPRRLRKGERARGIVRRARSIYGQDVTLYRASLAGFDPDGGEWVMVCEAHKTTCNVRSRPLAEIHLHGAGWCGACTGAETGAEAEDDAESPNPDLGS